MKTFQRRTLCLLFLPLIAGAVATPAIAGEWVRGGTFDPDRGVGVSFMRFLAGDGEGQMTIRCDEDRGLWLDVGAAGGGNLPDGAETGDIVSAVIEFVGSEETVAETVNGELLVRSDGAVLVTVIGEDAARLGPLYLQPFERIDITIGAETRPVPLAPAIDLVLSLAEGCDAWPRD